MKSASLDARHSTRTASLFSGLAGGDRGARGGRRPSVAAPTSPLRFDVRLLAPSTLRIENNLARLVASADLTLRGTYDRPLLFGRAEVERGEVTFEGRRYLVTRGTIDFTNPTRIEPFFDIEAETRVRVPGQTYRVTRARGRARPIGCSRRSPPIRRCRRSTSWRCSSATPAPSGDVELAGAAAARTSASSDLLAARATRALTGPLSAEVGRVVEQTFGVDTFQLTPSLIDPYQQSARLSVNPSARVTIGKRISDRVYLTFSRSLSSSTRDQIILLEYDESDRCRGFCRATRISTYALEVRVRHTF